MYFVNRDEKLTPNKIGSIINAFRTQELPRLEKYRNNYLGKQEILQKTVNDDSKPCNKVITNYLYQIVETYAGYMTGIDITYTSDEDIEAIQDVLNYNDVSSEDTELLKNALIFGTAYEVMWIDEDGKQRFKCFDPRECIPVYENTIEQDLAAVIRFYAVFNIEKNYADYYVDVYDAKETTCYKSNQNFSGFELLDFIPNFYGQVPVNVFYFNEQRESIFDKVITLQNAYNTLVSAEIDNFEAFVDCYLALTGVEVDEDSLHLMRTNRVLLLPEGGTAEFLNKNINDTQIENMLDNIRQSIREIAACPDFSDNAFGTSSGIAIRYKLLNFENKASQIEKAMTKALQRRIELICAILQLTGGEEMWRDIQIVFTRNLPVDTDALVAEVNSLRGLVSDKTLLAQVPFVVDIDAELEAIAEQNALNASLYSFSSGGNENEENMRG